MSIYCAGVNWKEPGTCEISHSKPDDNAFSTVGSCTYLRPGTVYVKPSTCESQYSVRAARAIIDDSGESS